MLTPLQNTRRLFQLVRQLAPKTSFRKIRFRDEKSGLMTKEQECKLMVSYAQALFTGTPFDVPALEPLPLHYFSADAWKAAFKVLQSHKAVPWFSASVEGWKRQVHAVAPLLERFSQTALCSANPRAPLAWSQVREAREARARRVRA